MAPPPAALPDELVEEILLRLPPDDPASILRASVVCKAWSSGISHPSFRRRLHDLHRTPPVLGFLHDWHDESISHFIPTTASSFSLAPPDRLSWRAIDCRHGRALFLSKGQAAWELLLWEPITGAQWRVPVPAAFESEDPTAAVLCAADGCDHRDCLGGPFRLVFVFFVESGTDDEEYATYACVYSSETDTWGEPTSPVGQIANFTLYSSVLVGNSLLYFMSDGESILEYDLARHTLTELNPPDDRMEEKFYLMLAETGELLVSESLNGSLKLWSRDLSGGTGEGWVLSRVIHFVDLLPGDALPESAHVLGFAEGANALFVRTVAGLFMVELQSKQARKVSDFCSWCNLIPVVGFYTPHSRLKALGGEHQASTLHTLCKSLVATNPSGSISKSAPNGESVKITATSSKDDDGSPSAPGSNVEYVPPLERGDSKEGENLNEKDKEDGSINMTGHEYGSDLHLAWKMLYIARGIVVKSSEKTMEKANIFYALAEVSVKRGDRDSAIDYYLKAIAILEHLLRPDDFRVVQLNFCVCLVFELTSRVGDAIPYCAKAISACKSHIENLKNAEEGLLAEKDVSVSTGGGHSGKFTHEDKISSVTRILARLQKKLEELEQGMSKQSSGKNVSQTSREQNVSNNVARAASLGSQVAGSNNSLHFQTMPTAAQTSSVSRGIKRANDELISAGTSPKRLEADDCPSVKNLL